MGANLGYSLFAGHGITDRRKEKGRIYINSRESLTVGDLKRGLKKAIEGGLQLAIFNSCDGLGLAWELEELHLPQIILMREPVPDVVAQRFLRYFLGAFAGGQSLYLAMRQARERLQEDGSEETYLCASWLPIIYQNAAALPPTWHSLRYGDRREMSERILKRAAIASVGVTILAILVRSLGCFNLGS